MNILGEIAGELCRMALPIPQESYCGNPDSPVAVCTLSSMDLLEDLAARPDILGRVCILGRLLSENRGIDAILGSLYARRQISVIIVCGRDGAGHLAGHSMLRLHDKGVRADGRIVGSHSPDPYLVAAPEQIAHFCQNTRLVDMVGVTDRPAIAACIRRHAGGAVWHAPQ